MLTLDNKLMLTLVECLSLEAFHLILQEILIIGRRSILLQTISWVAMCLRDIIFVRHYWLW